MVVANIWEGLFVFGFFILLYECFRGLIICLYSHWQDSKYEEERRLIRKIAEDVEAQVSRKIEAVNNYKSTLDKPKVDVDYTIKYNSPDDIKLKGEKSDGRKKRKP